MGDVLKRISHVPRGERRSLIEEWVFSARDRQLVADKLMDESITYEELAEKYHLCTKRVQEIVKEAVDSIAAHY